MFLVANKHMGGGGCSPVPKMIQIVRFVLKKKSVEDTEIKFEIPILKEKMDVKLSAKNVKIAASLLHISERNRPLLFSLVKHGAM